MKEKKTRIGLTIEGADRPAVMWLRETDFDLLNMISIDRIKDVSRLAEIGASVVRLSLHAIHMSKAKDIVE
jgi:hypothetical protein